ncbi:cell division protein ZapE [Nocardia sp. NPDC050710]|uniref:cell division protein ZapE n=1 Tax=Nocardia sp. NPDC050710 TaxID=3157220 RepID=UPI00340DC034
MEAGGIELDADQRRAAARLAELVDRRGRPVTRHRGIYLHGRPGRGKTMVMDGFFAGVASARKRRFHFHQFFAQLHAAAHECRSIDKAIDRLLGNAVLVCFDEFHVHDIGDAMLIGRMLDALFARRIALVLTSNYPPAELLPNPLFHDKFLPTIDRIVANLDVVPVDGPIDYRTTGVTAMRAGFAAGRYLVAPTVGAVESCAGPAVGGALPVRVGTRRIYARATTADSITIDFAALCGTPTSAADYVELARRFRRWTLCAVPLLGEVAPDWVMRLVNLVDVLYDADLELTVYAAAPLSELVRGLRGVPDIDRTRSRLGEISQYEPVPAG